VPESRKTTPRQRLLAAYEGRFSDIVPVAPEFWYYVPARLLGVSMIETARAHGRREENQP